MTSKVTTAKKTKSSNVPTIAAQEVGGATDEGVGGDEFATVTMVMVIHITILITHQVTVTITIIIMMTTIHAPGWAATTVREIVNMTPDMNITTTRVMPALLPPPIHSITIKHLGAYQ